MESIQEHENEEESILRCEVVGVVVMIWITSTCYYLKLIRADVNFNLSTTIFYIIAQQVLPAEADAASLAAAVASFAA